MVVHVHIYIRIYIYVYIIVHNYGRHIDEQLGSILVLYTQLSTWMLVLLHLHYVESCLNVLFVKSKEAY